MNDELISLPKAALLCSISRWTLRSSVKSGKIKAFQTPGGHYRIYKKDLEAFMTQMGMNTNKDDGISSKTILVVDDDASIRRLLSKALSSEGFHVKTASNGFTAGQKTIHLKPDLVIIDLFMPQMNGFEVCRRLKQDKATTHIKIIAISGFDTKENRQKIIKCGADLFLPKPIDIKKMKQSINILL